MYYFRFNQSFIINFENRFIMETPGFFQQFFGIMGPFRWPMIIIFIFVIALILIKVYDIYILKDPDQKIRKKWINAILFWGSFNLALGILCQLIGLWQVFRIIEQVQDISPTMILGGFLSSFSSVIFGLVTFLVAGLGWFGLRLKI